MFTSSDGAMRGIRGLAVTVSMSAVLVSVAACTDTVDSASSTSVSTTTVTVPPPSADTSSVVAAPTAVAVPLAPGTTKSLQALLADLPGTVGISIAPVGGTAPGALFGDLPTDVAWSTIKVPLSLAAFREFGATAQPDIELAIVNSDNAAAERLWAMLGSPTQAAAAVQDILREAGDTTTVVQSQRVRSGFTAFGQTQWSLTEQARFAARLPCLPQSAGILALMGEVDGSQQWGAAALEGSAVKGGWGPQAAGGGYLVRQLAVVPAASGDVAITMATTPDAGDFDDGTVILDTVATWISENLDQLPAGEC